MKTFHKNYSLAELKIIIKSWNKHFRIMVTGKKKKELADELSKHLEHDEHDEIQLKQHSVDFKPVLKKHRDDEATKKVAKKAKKTKAEDAKTEKESEEKRVASYSNTDATSSMPNEILRLIFNLLPPSVKTNATEGTENEKQQAEQIENLNDNIKKLIKNYKDRKTEVEKQFEELNRLSKEHKKDVDKQNKYALSLKVSMRFSRLNKIIEDKTKLFNKLLKSYDEQDETFLEKNKTVDDKEQRLREKVEYLEDKDTRFIDLDDELDKIIKQHNEITLRDYKASMEKKS
jgi:DNA repair exonuclease SbcCD ATPase subunit